MQKLAYIPSDDIHVYDVYCESALSVLERYGYLVYSSLTLTAYTLTPGRKSPRVYVLFRVIAAVFHVISAYFLPVIVPFTAKIPPNTMSSPSVNSDKLHERL